MTRMIPLVVLINEDDKAKLDPIINDLAERLAPMTEGLPWRLNGWTPEMLAWSRALHLLAEQDLEVEVRQ